MFIKKKSTRQQARKHEVLLRLWSRLITLVTLDFFDRKVSSWSFKAKSQHKLSTRPGIPGLTWLGPSRPFCSRNIGWWHFSNISSDTSAQWAHESTSLDVNKPNGMLTSHGKRIFSDNVTCFGKNKSCSNRSHLPQCFIKALRFLFAWLLCFYTENPRFFLEGDIRNTPDSPGRNTLYFALENKDKNMSLVFLVWHHPCFFSFSGMVWRLPI